MTPEDLPNRQTNDPRRRAVERVAEHIREAVLQSGNDTRRMLQEMERYSIEAELQIEELRRHKVELDLNYDELYDSAPVGYFTLGGNGEIEIVNLTGAGMVRQPRAALPNRQFADLLTPDSLSSFNAFLRRVTQGYDNESCVVSLIRGGDTPVSAYIYTTGMGPESSFRVVVVKITSAEQARLSLREREARLDLALTASSIGVWEWERNTGDVYWSRECVSISGIDSICPTLETVAQLLHPEDAPWVRSIISRALAQNEEPTVECRIVRPNGDVVWILAHGRIRLNEKGEPLRLFGIVQDVTERKRAEQTAGN